MENNDNAPSTPAGVIPVKKAIELNNEWTKTRAEAMNQCISDVTGGKVTKDNRSSWWSIEDLEAYLKYAKQQAKKMGYEMSGIRMYCGAYSDDDCYSTSFMVPTAKSSLGKDGGDDDEDDLPIPPLNDGEDGIPPGDGYTGGN